jgi:hypothetical protein
MKYIAFLLSSPAQVLTAGCIVKTGFKFPKITGLKFPSPWAHFAGWLTFCSYQRRDEETC